MYIRHLDQLRRCLKYYLLSEKFCTEYYDGRKAEAIILYETVLEHKGLLSEDDLRVLNLNIKIANDSIERIETQDKRIDTLEENLWVLVVISIIIIVAFVIFMKKTQYLKGT